MLAAISAMAANTYTATPLQLPADLADGGQPFMQVYGFNNLGQVLGEAGASSNDRRGPYVWTNGVPTKLPIPAGRFFLGMDGTFKINDSGDVAGDLLENVSFGAITQLRHAYIWKNFVPTELVPPRFVCPAGGVLSTAPMSYISGGLNNAGHVFGSSAYFYLHGVSPCYEHWLYAGGSFRRVDLSPAYVTDGNPPLGYVVLNDADQIALPTYTGTVILNPDGSTRPVPPAFGWPTGANSRGQFLGFYKAQSGETHLTLWDPQTGVTDLGPSGYGFLNNLGQIAFLLLNPLQSKIWDKGTVTNVTYPVLNPPISPNSIFTLINDAGQLAGPQNDSAAIKYVLTPSGNGCADAIDGSVSVTRGGFRYNRANQHYTQTITITNTTASALTGPFSVALDGLPQSALLFGVAGATLCAAPQGSPYLNNAAATLAPGASAAFTLEFINTQGSGISYSTRVLAGPGGR
ncbi:MAG: hypothetical protein IT165_32475 [Bryobacterales bacterium]|nr:hypothetical protein [Bryobacterales bacterium]